MRTITACLALTSAAAWAHPGHAAPALHLHPDAGWGLVALAAAAIWLLARSGRR